MRLIIDHVKLLSSQQEDKGDPEKLCEEAMAHMDRQILSEVSKKRPEFQPALNMAQLVQEALNNNQFTP